MDLKESLQRAKKAIESMKNGEIVVVFDDEKRENEADLILAASASTAEKVDFIITKGRGLLCIALSQEIAQEKGFALMGTNKKDPHGTAFTISVDHIDCKTGISPRERSLTAQKIADRTTKFQDFITPGHLFPLIAKDGLLLERRGHTEAAVALAKFAGLEEASLICELVGCDGFMCDADEAEKFAQEYLLPYCTIKDLLLYSFCNAPTVEKVSDAALKTEFGDFTISVYRDLTNGKEHAFIKRGEWQKGIVRVHSECFTGDIFHSKSCDCRNQLDQALQKINDEGQGAIVYLRQEGRGIGLGEKIKAYNLQQNQGLDTVDANLKLGFQDDERDYHQAAWMLRAEGANEKIRLLTGNPEKIKYLQFCGFDVEQIVPEYHIVKENQFYLETKKNRMKHTIGGVYENN